MTVNKELLADAADILERLKTPPPKVKLTERERALLIEQLGKDPGRVNELLSISVED